MFVSLPQYGAPDRPPTHGEDKPYWAPEFYANSGLQMIAHISVCFKGKLPLSRNSKRSFPKTRNVFFCVDLNAVGSLATCLFCSEKRFVNDLGLHIYESALHQVESRCFLNTLERVADVGCWLWTAGWRLHVKRLCKGFQCGHLHVRFLNDVEHVGLTAPHVSTLEC